MCEMPKFGAIASMGQEFLLTCRRREIVLITNDEIRGGVHDEQNRISSSNG